MADPIFRDLMQKMARLGGRYPGMDIPEFYAMASALFTPEEAAVAVAMPRGFATGGQVAEALGRSEEEVERVLRAMAAKPLCLSRDAGGTEVYLLLPLYPGVLDTQFSRGTRTERDIELARLIHEYKEAVDAINGTPEIAFPRLRVIAVDEKMEAGSTIHTYDQMSTYVENSDLISVATCYCRHHAALVDENDTCGKPNEVCMHFNAGARFFLDIGIGREISKKEAMAILKKSEEAGLVHCSHNHQDLDFVCNCCADHCVNLRDVLAQPKPALALNSGFEPRIDQEECIACAVCIETCPSAALAMSEEDLLARDLDRCIGCGLCATSCATEAIVMVEKADRPEPPVDQRAWWRALRQVGFWQ